MAKRYLFLMLIVPILLFAKEDQSPMLQKRTIQSAKYFDINRIKSAIRNDGIFARHPITGNTDCFFDGKELIYTSGLWLAAKVNGEIRASAADFNTDWIGGAIDANGIPFGKEDSTFRVYKISRGDNVSNNPDYAEWPMALGAPSDGQGNPLLIGDQTLWCSFTDAFAEERIWYNICDPLGAEVHLTVWGWEDIDNFVFLRWEIVNKSQDVWEDAYIGLHSDPDVGDANNDLSGSDSTLNMVYCFDHSARNYYHDNFAVGYILLESPLISSAGDTATTWQGKRINFRNAPVYAPRIEKLSSEGWGEAIYTNSRTATIIYNRLRCLNFDGNPAIDPITNKISHWAFSGDPVSGTGWLYETPLDQRMMLSTGPVTLAPGDTAALMIAIACVGKKDQLNTIVDLKNDAHFLRSAFKSQFQVQAKAIVEVDNSSETQSNVVVESSVASLIPVSSVTAKFLNYKDELIHDIDLFDDGAHFDEMANDSIYGNVWLATPRDEPLYMNVIVNDFWGNEFCFERAQSYITLSNKIDINAHILADHINSDGNANPGENLRLGFEIANDYSFALGKVGFSVTDIDTFISFRSISFHLDSISPGGNQATNYLPSDRFSYLTFDLPSDIPDNHIIKLSVEIYEQGHLHWNEFIQVPVFPFEYVPNEIIPTQISGKSDASFVVRVLDPSELTNHSYMISISDFSNEKKEKGFHLIDQTLADTLLFNSPSPDQYAYNIPVTDGFKVGYGNIPVGGLKDVNYQNIEGGHPSGFEGVNIGGKFFDGGVSLGLAPEDKFCPIELEFTNSIDSTGVVDFPGGQNAFRYEFTPNTNPTGFLPCPFTVWKIFRDERIGKLNACFTENPNFPTYNNTWAPDTSQFGGFEVLYIMSSDYDPSGQIYLGKRIDPGDVLYKVHLRLKSRSSVVDAGDKIIFDWEYPATHEDKFVFIPTQIKEHEYSPQIDSYVLFQNYPNPFNHSTQIKFQLEKGSLVKLAIFNVLGQKVSTLIDEFMEAGQHKISWDGSHFSGQKVVSGLYFYQLKTEDEIICKKMLLLK